MNEELIVRTVLSVVMAAAGVLLLWMARAAASGRLRRNALAGIRTASTMASDEAWLAAHQRAERPTRLAGLVALGTAVAVLLPIPEDALFATVMVGAAVILALVVYGALVGGRAARSVGDG